MVFPRIRLLANETIAPDADARPVALPVTKTLESLIVLDAPLEKIPFAPFRATTQVSRLITASPPIAVKAATPLPVLLAILLFLILTVDVESARNPKLFFSSLTLSRDAVALTAGIAPVTGWMMIPPAA